MIIPPAAEAVARYMYLIPPDPEACIMAWPACTTTLGCAPRGSKCKIRYEERPMLAPSARQKSPVP